MSKGSSLLVALKLVLCLTCTAGVHPVSAAITGDGIGDEVTLFELHNLTEFKGLDQGQFTRQMWVDPYLGNDSNPGTYQAPLRSFRMIKQACINSANMRCTVKGRNRAFSPRALTVSFSAGGTFIQGEAVQTTFPTANGFVVAADGNHVVLTITTAPTNVWGTNPTAPEPRVSTVIHGVTSGSTAIVSSFEDTIVGLHSVLFAPTDISPGSPAVITVDHHGYSDNDGPLMWLNETSMPNTTAPAVLEFTTQLYVCNSTTNTFEISMSPTCVGSRVSVQSVGAGSSQLVDYHTLGWSGGPNISVGVAAEMKCSAATRDRICALFESEYPDSPWIIDGGGYYLSEIRAKIYPEVWPGASTGASYNTPIGYLVGVANSNPDLSQGWFGIQNGTIQNLSMDALATTHGGKLIALNVKAKAIRNGVSDRSQYGMANPAYQAHNSCVQITGTAIEANKTGAVAYWINGGDSWNYQGSHTGSGGCINANQKAVLRVISRGIISSDVFPTDNTCMGTACQSSLIVNPAADLTVVGPLELSTGPLANANNFSASGVGTASRFYKVIFNRKGSYPTFNTVLPAFFTFPPLSAPLMSTLDMNEVIFKNADKGALFTICEAETGATRIIVGKNINVEAAHSVTYQAVISDCGGTACLGGGDCGDAIDAIQNTNVSLVGILDHAGSEKFNYYFVQPNTRLLGDCGAAGTFRGDLCNALIAGGRQTAQWSWFESRGSPPDPGGTKYLVSMRSEVFPEFVQNDSCLPRDVLGTQLCALRLTESLATPEPAPGLLLAAGIVLLRRLDRLRRRKSCAAQW